jgi:sugar phosphate permease
MESKRWSNNYSILLITWIGWISIYLARSVLPPLLPVISLELGFTHTQSGLLETAYLIGYIIIKIPSGVLCEKHGARKILAFSMIGYGASTFFISYAQNFLHIFLLRFFVGLFQGVHLPVSNALLSDRFNEKQGKAIGFNESGPNIGNTIAFPIAVSIMSRWGWRIAFVLLSFPAFILSLATLFFMKDNQEELASEDTTERSKISDYMLILFPYALAHATYNLILRATFTFTPSFLFEFKGLDIVTAGFFAMVLPFAGIFSKLGSGFVLERIGARNAICGATLISAIFLASLVIVSNETFLVLNLVALGLALYSFSPIIYSSTTSSLPSDLKALGLGVVTMIGNIIGAVSTSVVGALIDIKSYSFTLYSISIVTILASVLIYLIMNPQHNLN